MLGQMKTDSYPTPKRLPQCQTARTGWSGYRARSAMSCRRPWPKRYLCQMGKAWRHIWISSKRERQWSPEAMWGLEIITVEPDGGSSNPTSLTFDFAPKLLIIGWQETLDNGFFTSNLGDRVTSDNYYSIYTGALTTQFKQYRGFGDPDSSYAKKSSDGKTITWYSTHHANSQRNDKRHKYYYLAIG